ncbi:MAG: Holliday junction branch migration protein RuvA [Planctomycetota bacterium]
MYDFLEGDVAGRSAARVVLDVRGVGYEVLVPPGASFPTSGRLRLWTHLVVREDSHALYGFRDEATRDMFRALLGVTGVGPKVALAVLSGLSCDELVTAVVAGDSKRLTKVKGIGQKTADQILLDLRGKAAALSGGTANAPAARGPVQLEDAVTALISIGYSEKDARKQVERAAKSVDPANLELLVRTALSS